MTAPILGLTETDFDAYLPERASSNAFSRPRLEFKQRALSWVRTVVSRLQDIDIAVDVHGSDEHPSVWNGHRVDCQWVFLWRDPDTRADLDALLDQRRGIAEALNDPSPFFRHAFLALRIDHESVEVCVQLHPNAWVDFETLRARLSDEPRARQVVEAIQDMPEQFSLGADRSSLVACSSIARASMLELLSQCATSASALWIGWRVPRAVAIEHTELLDEQLADALIALAPVYQQIAWSHGDDPAHIADKLAEMREDLSRAAAEHAARTERDRAEADRQRRETTEKSRERTRERVDYGAARPRPTLGNLFKPDSAAAAPKPQRPVSSPRPPSGSQRVPLRHPAEEPRRPPAPRAVPRQPEHPDHAEPIEKGSKVKVLSGAFAGKVGVVNELDARGGARILLGLLSTRVALEDLAVVTDQRDRPALQTSHRRPMPTARSPKEQRDK
ncbi:MAG: hypothetical protein HY898_04625 [Deltaproteobacteria bacterium]|nr:hypothetical protein [Deltaproteobacteria bacterium]